MASKAVVFPLPLGPNIILIPFWSFMVFFLNSEGLLFLLLLDTLI
tara:strand:- start:374 stop:508 length:135 start_codon:yes stop_codon:yes gene_type:complete